jgi:dTDP-4-dehydrorhamnose reductase
VVADQHGCPTFADDLADALLTLAEQRVTGRVLHFSNDGPTTWHAFAEAIVTAARAHADLKCTRIDAITTAEYPTPARRPKNSVLETSRIRALGVHTP